MPTFKVVLIKVLINWNLYESISLLLKSDAVINPKINEVSYE